MSEFHNLDHKNRVFTYNLKIQLVPRGRIGLRNTRIDSVLNNTAKKESNKACQPNTVASVHPKPPSEKPPSDAGPPNIHKKSNTKNTIIIRRGIAETKTLIISTPSVGAETI